MIHPFHDRTRELDALLDHWSSGRAELLVVYGRRRIGKTYLLRRFSGTRPAVYYTAARLPETQQLREIGVLFGDHLDDDLLRENGFRDWDQLLRLLGRLEDRILLVLDEYPYLVESSPGLSSRLQRAWDERLLKTEHMIVLCGSSVGMMKRETMDAAAPLHGRRTGHLKLEPMAAPDAAAFVPRWGEDDVVRAYAAFGGVPHYLAMLDDSESLADNIERTMIRLGAPLRDEVEFLLRQELNEPRVYFGVLAAIAAGRRKMSEIVNTTGMPHGSISKYLAVLQHLGIVEREVPVTEARPEKSKKGLYRIVDPFVRLWMRHLLPIRGLLEAGREVEACGLVLEGLERSAPEVYEEICRGLVRSGALDRVTGRRWARAGRWWDRTHEIDVLAFTPDDETILVGEAKWSSRAVGVDILDRLISSADNLPGDLPERPRHLVLFSRSGFTDAVLSRAESDPTLTLVRGLDAVD